MQLGLEIETLIPYQKLNDRQKRDIANKNIFHLT